MKDEIKVITCVVLLLLALESGTRIFETQLSKDVEHLRELPQQAAVISNAPASSYKVLVLGNSLARCGINIPLLSDGLRRQTKREAVIATMYPDGTNIEQWSYGYRRYFSETGATPDLVLMVTGRLHLTDQVQSVSNMGAFYVSNQDLLKFANTSLHDAEACADFFGARYSVLFANRTRVEPLMFYNVVPGYADTAQEINHQLSLDRIGQNPAPHELTSKTFYEFATQTKSTGVKLVIVSAPLPDPYQLPDSVLKAANSGGATVMQISAAHAIPANHFPDKYHLDNEGSKIFTQHFLDNIAKLGFE